MCSEGSPVTVELIDNHIFQVRKNKIKPVFTVIWQECRIQHLRVCQNNIRAFPYPAPLRRHGIPVVDSRRDPSFAEIFQKRLKRPVLIRRKSLGRIYKDRPGEGILQDLLQYREQKTQCLSTGRGRCDHHILTALRFLEHLRLMSVKARDIMTGQITADIRVKGGRKISKRRRMRRHCLCVNDQIPDIF